MEQEATRRSLLGDLSLTQVIVGAMAAATSFAFSQRIGVLGSVIGAAIGSVAASITSQIYRSIIDRSIEGFRGVDQHGTVQRHARPSRMPYAAAALALLVGIGALGVYMTGVDLFTGGAGIGTQAPIVEYIYVPAEEPAPEEKPEATVEEDAAAATEQGSAEQAEAAVTDVVAEAEDETQPEEAVETAATEEPEPQEQTEAVGEPEPAPAVQEPLEQG